MVEDTPVLSATSVVFFSDISLMAILSEDQP